MSSDRWLTQRGAQLLALIAEMQPVFLVELNVTDELADELYHHIPRSFGALWTPEARICLAVAAVHAASHADQNEASFRELFFSHLRRPFDQFEWENSYGPAIRYCLEQHFNAELPPTGRPHCYVGAIYRHAGIPAPARSSFSKLLADLLRSGPVFTRGQYGASLSSITSTVARRFLESDAGYEFTQRVAQLVLRVDAGRVPIEELNTLPGYQPALISEVLCRIRGLECRPRPPGIGAAPFPVPHLALDRGTRGLIVQFDPKGVAAGAYKLGTETVLYPTLPFPGPVPPNGYFVKPCWCPWRVKKWWCPGESSSALFRSSDGAFVSDSGEISCGSYLLVTSIPDQVPLDIVREEGAFLEQEESPDYYSILEIEISPGDDLSGLGFYVRGSPPRPTIQFSAKPGHPLGANVFAAFLPEVEMLNWTPEISRQYWIWGNDGSGERRIAADPDSNRITVPTACPSRGEIWLEEKAHGRVVDRLPFSVVPRDLSIYVVESCVALILRFTSRPAFHNPGKSIGDSRWRSAVPACGWRHPTSRW